MNPDAVSQAQKLVEDLQDVEPGELALIKRQIEEWARGDEFARGYIMRFAYTRRPHNSPIINQVINLIEGR